MYKAIQVIFLLCLLSCTAYSQTILLKMGEDANMKYEDEKNKIIAPSEGIKTDKKEIFLMAGFPEAAQTRKKVTFSITGTDDCKITYNGALRQNLSLNGNILRYLELIKVEFLADQVEGSIVIKVNNEGELTYPLQYNVPGAAAGDQNTPDAGNSVTDNDQNATGQDSTTDVEVDPSKVNAPPTPNPNPPPNPWKSAFLILLFLTVSAGILGFILYRRLKHDANEKSEKPDEETTGATDAEEAIQLALLNHLMGGEGEATNHYSTGIQEKVAMVKDRYGLSEKQNVDQAAYRKLEEQVRQSQLENSQLQTQVQEADQTLHETRQLLDKVAYPPYYLTFNDGLQEVFQDLEKAREHLKSESHFNEIFNKIMNHSSKQVPHPLLWFAGRDKHVLNSLDLNSRDELANLDKDTFFEKYVLWQGGHLINNLSKLYTYVKFRDHNLNLEQILQEDGVATSYIESAFDKLSRLLADNFGISIQVPPIGSTTLDPDLWDKVDYCFVKTKFFDKLPNLAPGTIYDMNKVTIVNNADNAIIQKGQVTVKV